MSGRGRRRALLAWGSIRHGHSGNTTELAISRQDIADYLGLTTETVSRTLSHLEREGTIGWPSARGILLRDRRAFAAALRVINRP